MGLTIRVFSVFCVTLATAAPALADPPAFTGPAGWSHVTPTTPSTDPNRKFDQWHIAGDVSSVTYIADASTAYADSLASIENNFKTNNIKPAVNKDTMCRGKASHVVEFATGPDGHRIVVNRLIVPDGNGVVTITYARSDGTGFDSDVQKAETAFCAATS